MAEVEEREMHLQLPGELVTAKFESAGTGLIKATLPSPVPTWVGMRATIVDLNGGNLRVAGGATSKF